MFIVEKQPEDDSPQAFLSAQNGSPRLSRAEVPARPAPSEAYDVVLQRKESEGFGFVILTSKNKPPPGGKGCCVLRSLPHFLFSESPAIPVFWVSHNSCFLSPPLVFMELIKNCVQITLET